MATFYFAGIPFDLPYGVQITETAMSNDFRRYYATSSGGESISFNLRKIGNTFWRYSGDINLSATSKTSSPTAGVTSTKAPPSLFERAEHRLFVYGSLRAGASAHQLLQGCRRDADGVLSGCSLVEHCGYPMLCTGAGQVKGEVCQVEAERWPALDAWEEAPEVYAGMRRQLDDGRCWVWMYQRPG